MPNEDYVPYDNGRHWRMTARSAVYWTERAISAINLRISQINPIDDLEEMEAAKKARTALKAAFQALEPLRSK